MVCSFKKQKKSIIVTNVFQKILDKFKSKPNELWVDKSSEFYNRSMQSWVQGNDIEMYSTLNEGKSLVAEMLFELWKIKSANMWPQYKKNVYW